jgi:hypothetical protein
MASREGRGRAQWGGVHDQPTSPTDPAPPANRRRDVRLVGFGVAGGLLVSFAVLNRGAVPVDLWVHHFRVPLILVIAIAGLLGALITMLARRFSSRRN